MDTSSNQNLQLRNYVWILNNPTDQEVLGIHTTFDNKPNAVQYLIYGTEVGEKTGREHLQGYLELKRSGTNLFS